MFRVAVFLVLAMASLGCTSASRDAEGTMEVENASLHISKPVGPAFDNDQIVATNKVLNEPSEVKPATHVSTLLLQALNSEEYCYERRQAWIILCRTTRARPGDQDWKSLQHASRQWEQSVVDLADVKNGVDRHYNFVVPGSGGMPSRIGWISGHYDSDGRYRWRR